MRLSRHFTLAELSRSATALERGIVNRPPASSIPLAREFCLHVLEAICERFGEIRVTSGYRCAELNAAVGGVASSDHQWGAEKVAVDIQPVATQIEEVFDWIRLESGLPFDQVILERGKAKDSEEDDCIHISYRTEPRRMALRGPTHGQGSYAPAEVA